MVYLGKAKWIVRPAASVAMRYGLALVSVAIALGLAKAFLYFHLPQPFTAFALSAIAITFWYGGTVPGILAALLSSLARGYFFEPEINSISRVLYDLVFLVFALLMTLVARARNELEVRVAERTADLTRANENLKLEIAERMQAEASLQEAFYQIKKLKDQLYQENLVLKEEIDQAFMFEEIVGSSEALRQVLVQVAKVAQSDSTVLILGETGTGKELIARAIHNRSNRSTRAFVRVNCAAIPPSLIASELFGHEKGAFTGALERRLGRFELANGGTIFLDEVGEIPTETQITLLRVLQEREFERVGASQPISVDVRVLAATNRDLRKAVETGAFRQDLFYRLNVFPIAVPPLRDRLDDIQLLVEYLIERYAKKAGKTITNITKRTLELFQAYDWPGNVRELQNVVERAIVLCEGNTFSVDETWLKYELPPEQKRTPVGERGLGRLDPRTEKEIIESALAECNGRIAGPTGAAAKLGIPRTTLESRIKALQINKYLFKS
jgi:transcriptional regulator with GAF, ATPase, and Fis domain